MSLWYLCIPQNAIWTMQCTCNFPTMHDGNFADFLDRIMEVFMDDFSVCGESFDGCLSNLELVLKRCVNVNLVLNWEKFHFMVRQGIVLGHIVSNRGIEVDKAKIEIIKNL